MSMDEMKNNVEQLARLTANLEAASTELDGINTEETLLAWEPTAFPQLFQMFKTKEPYDKLWNTALSFHIKSDEWLNGEDICPWFTSIEWRWWISEDYTVLSAKSIQGL